MESRGTGYGLARVFFRDGTVQWAHFDDGSGTVDPVLWADGDSAERAGRRERMDRMHAASRLRGTLRAVHGVAGTAVVDMERVEPVVVEACASGSARWWCALADRDGGILATNRDWTEVDENHRGLFRAHPVLDEAADPVFTVTGPAFVDLDWGNLDVDAPTPPGP